MKHRIAGIGIRNFKLAFNKMYSDPNYLLQIRSDSKKTPLVIDISGSYLLKMADLHNSAYPFFRLLANKSIS